MPKFKDHLLHSRRRHPDIPEKKHESVHRWMDNPANWPVDTPYESGFMRKHGRSGHNHRDIRHDPPKVANALSGGNDTVRKQVHKIAKCHAELDGRLTPNIQHRIVEADHFTKTKKFRDDLFVKTVTSLKNVFRRKKI